MSHRKLETLEVGRALAALAVVAHHAQQASSTFTSQRVGAWLDYGALGVDFFFVLSGFIIYFVHGADHRSPDQAIQFLRTRFVRIYVPYLPVTLLLIGAYTFLPSVSAANREWSALTSLTLIPTHFPPALSVAWTLIFEMIFYLFFFIFFYFVRGFWWAVAVWSIVTVWFSIGGMLSNLASPVLEVAFHPLTLEFVAGMVAAAAYKRLPSKLWPLALLIGMLAVTTIVSAGDLHRSIFGLSLAPLVLSAAMMETRYKFNVPRKLLSLGSASYAIYLVHNPVISLVARAVGRVDDWHLTFFSCLILGILAGVIYCSLFERPMLMLFKTTKIADRIITPRP